MTPRGLRALTIALLACALVWAGLITIAAKATAADNGGGVYGWRCHNVRTLGNTLEQLDWLARNTNGVGCETDAREDAEGRLWVFHDPNLPQVDRDTLPARFNGRSLTTSYFDELTTAEVRDLRYKSGRKVVTAAQFLRRIKARRLQVMVEVKGDRSGLDQRQVDQLVGITDRLGIVARWESQAGMTYLIPMLKNAGARKICAKSSLKKPETLRALGATCVSTKHYKITKQFVADYREHGIAVRSMMAGPAKYPRLKRIQGAVRVVTNKPAAAGRWLARH